jgi:hypothetical protein
MSAESLNGDRFILTVRSCMTLQQPLLVVLNVAIGISLLHSHGSFLHDSSYRSLVV